LDYKLDEGRSTPHTFYLSFDGGIFVGLYDHSPISAGVEPYPEGTPVVLSVPSSGSQEVVQMHGSVISVPLLTLGDQLSYF
jgi:hypothetical protein